MEFKVGQKVRMVEDICDARVGDIGIIVAVPGDNHSYAVEFPCFNGVPRGHSCDRLVPSGNGHWIEEYEMEPVQEDFPEITQVTIKDDSGTTTVRAKVIKGDDGYTIEKLAEPKFTVGEQFVTASGKLGKVTKVNPDGSYGVQWFNGKYIIRADKKLGQTNRSKELLYLADEYIQSLEAENDRLNRINANSVSKLELDTCRSLNDALREENVRLREEIEKLRSKKR